MGLNSKITLTWPFPLELFGNSSCLKDGLLKVSDKLEH